MSVSITARNGQVLVVSPFNPAFTKRAKALGGRWQPESRSWVFDARDEDNIRQACMDIYGFDGRPVVEADLVTLRVTFPGGMQRLTDAIRIGGREVARARGRDSGATIGAGVVFLAGTPTSGGSVKNWQTVIRAGSVVEIRDFPRSMVPEAEDHSLYAVEVLPNRKPIDRAALEAERDKIRTRLAEIDALLTEATAGGEPA